MHPIIDMASRMHSIIASTMVIFWRSFMKFIIGSFCILLSVYDDSPSLAGVGCGFTGGIWGDVVGTFGLDDFLGDVFVAS